jgi:hemoglobin-like flavoprotein
MHDPQENLANAYLETKKRIPSSYVSEVQNSWEMVMAQGSKNFGVLLLMNILGIAPEAADLFSRMLSHKDRQNLATCEPFKRHGSVLQTTIDTIVAGLRDFEALVPMLEKLGERHVRYKVIELHYEIFGQALLSTIEQSVTAVDEAKFEETTKGAWTAVYAAIAETMKGGLYKK